MLGETKIQETLLSMKKYILTLALGFIMAGVGFAQNNDPNYIARLESKNPNPKVAAIHFIDIKKGEPGHLNLEVNWGGENGGSTFHPQNLALTNATIVSSKPVGQIGAKNPKQTWVIKVTDPTKSVGVEWNTPGTINFCGGVGVLVGATYLK